MLARLRYRILLLAALSIALSGLSSQAFAQVVQDEVGQDEVGQAPPPQAVGKQQPPAEQPPAEQPEAEQPEAEQPPAERPGDGPEAVELKRAWLRGVLSAQLSNERQLRLMNQRVTEMTEAQLDRAIAAQKRKLRKVRGQANQADQLLRQRLAAQQIQERQALQAIALGRNQWRAGFVDGFVLGHRDPVVAYAPGLTWLPVGSALYPRRVVTWGGRRVYVDPWFHRHSHHPHFINSPVVETPILPPEDNQPRVWYDGLRTRYGVPSGPFKDRF